MFDISGGNSSFRPDFRESNASFKTGFNEFSALYRGVENVWIGDGTNGTAGYLYAQYKDNTIQELGFVSDYEEAKEYFAQLGIELTYAEWVALLAAIPENANLAVTSAGSAQDSAELAQRLADSIKSATVTVGYQNSDNGRVHPVGGTWTSTPNPEQSKFMWTKIQLTWTDNSVSSIYTVSYIGVDGSGAVHSVNSKSGHVMLYSSDIAINSSDAATIEERLQIASTSEIDALF